MSFQAYMDNIRVKTGNAPEDFAALARENGSLDPLPTAGTITDRLKADFGLGHGHAMALFAYFKGKPS